MSVIDKINVDNVKINRSLSAALNRFFKKNPYMAEGCKLKKNWDGRDYVLIIEESELYNELNYGISEGALIMFEEFGIKPETWKVHTEFHESFHKCDYYPEMDNSCVVAFYKFD